MNTDFFLLVLLCLEDEDDDDDDKEVDGNSILLDSSTCRPNHCPLVYLYNRRLGLHVIG